MWKTQITMSNIAVFTWERWINPKSWTPKREITLADMKEKQYRGNTLPVYPAVSLKFWGFFCEENLSDPNPQTVNIKVELEQVISD